MAVVPLWKLYQYQSAGGRKAIEDWRKDLTVGPRVDMDSFLNTMAKKDEWEYPDIGPLKGKKYKGLTELRWRSGNVPHRILGYKKADHEYIMLIGCTHNKKKYRPPEALDTALGRAKKLSTGEATICEYKLITNK